MNGLHPCRTIGIYEPSNLSALEQLITNNYLVALQCSLTLGLLKGEMVSASPYDRNVVIKMILLGQQ